MKAILSTYHQMIKFPTRWGVREINGKQRVAREFYQNTMKKKKELLQQLQETKVESTPKTPSMEELDEVSIDPEKPEHKVFIESRLSRDIRE